MEVVLSAHRRCAQRTRKLERVAPREHSQREVARVHVGGRAGCGGLDAVLDDDTDVYSAQLTSHGKTTIVL